MTLLPTPAVNDMGEGKTVEAWDAWTAKMQAKHGNGNGHGASLAIEAQRLLPTPAAQEPGYTGPLIDGDGNPATHVMQRVYDPVTGRLVQTGLEQFLAHTQEWGQYADAIHRWEQITRPAPVPTEQDWEKWGKRKAARLASRKPVGMRGSIRFIVDGPSPRLSARFSEWLMGLPDGWITDVPGITRNEALKAAGNGVVPQQAAAALRLMLARAEAVAA